MPITLITGPANTGKARAVLDAVERHVAHGEQPLLVLPTGRDADRYRRELAQHGPSLGVHVCLFADLLEQLARRAAASDPQLGRPSLSATARTQMLATLAASLPGGGRASSSRRSLASALGGAIAELQAAGVSPDQMRRALGSGAAAEPRLRLLLELHRQYNRCLASHGVLDLELRARRALDLLRQSPALWSVSGRPTPVLLYGFDDLTALQIDVVETLGKAIDAPVTVSLAYEAGRVAFAGRAWAFQELAPAAKHLPLPARSDYYAPAAREALHTLERRIFEQDGADDQPPEGTEGVRLLQTSSQHAELRRIATEVRLLIDEGLAPGEIAIVHRAPASIADGLAEVLDAAGVPHAIACRMRFADTALGRALVGLLACGCSGVEGVGDASIADLLSWLRAPGLLQRVELADRLEAHALRNGVRDAAAARALWEAEHWPLDTIDRVASSARAGAVALLECAKRELRRLFDTPFRGRATVLDPAREEVARAVKAGLAAISELLGLADLDPGLLGGAEGVLDALRDIELPAGGLGGDAAVAVLDPLSLRARRVRALFLCGLQQGVFPASGRPDPILSQETRARLVSVCGNRFHRREDTLSAERYLFYASVSRAEQQLLLSVHACNDDGEVSLPSLFLDDLRDLFGDRLDIEREPARTQTRERELGRVASVAAATRSRALGIEALQDARLLAELRERQLWSASSLERFAACPTSWFIERMLSADGLDPEPEPRARGTLAHAVLGETFEALRRERGSARITAPSLQAARKAMRETLARLAETLPLAVAAERIPLARRRLEADLDRYLQHAAQQESPLEPRYVELSFGFPKEAGGLPPLTLADGVQLRGRIDRVDVDEHGRAVVYDYKSGRTGPEYSGARWAKGGRFQIALYMRAVQELVGLEVVGGLYQPLAGSDLRARGVLSSDAGLDLECVRTDSCDAEQLSMFVEEACEAAAKAASQARAGLLQARPESCGYGGGCTYPTICRCGG
jgi:ATP-dependent helicase/DNAse subunit B